MQRILFYLIFSIITPFTFAQTITTYGPETYNGICVGKSIYVPFNKTGEFGASNKFKVQMIFYRYENYQPNEYKLMLEGESATSPVQVMIPDTLTGIEDFKLKVISTDPVIEGTPTMYGTRLNHFLRVQLNKTAITINPGEFTAIDGRLTGIGPGKIYLSDNTVLDIGQSYSDFYFSKNPTTTTTYSVVKTENACGVSEPKPAPTITLNVNPIGFKLINTEIQAMCSGGSVFLTYDSQKAFNTDNEFTATIGYSVNQRPSSKFISITCEKTGTNSLSFKLPEFPVDSTIHITSLQLNSSSPKAIALNSSAQVYFPLNDMPNFAIKTNQLNINWNEETEIVILKKSDKHYLGDIVLNDGKGDIELKYSNQSYQNEIHYIVKPDVTTNYQIRTQPKGCEMFSRNLGTVEVKVNPGVRVLNVPKSACENSKVRIKIAKRGNFNPDNVFSIELHYQDQNSQKIIIPATILNDSTAEFTLGDNYFSDSYRYEYQNAVVKLRSSSPFSISEALDITIQRSPTLKLQRTYYTFNEGNTYVGIHKEDTGGQPYKYLVSDGINEYLTSQLAFAPAKSTDYSIKQIRNQCGITFYDNLKINITVPKSVHQVVQPLGEASQNIRACVGSQIEIPFIVNGTRDTSDTYHFEIRKIINNQEEWVSIGSTKTSPFRIIFPNNLEFYTYYYRISNPSKKLVWFYNYQLTLLRLPTAKISNENSQSILLPGNEAWVSYLVTGGSIITTELSDGQKKETQTDYDGNRWDTFRFQIYSTHTYRLKSVRNECGIGKVEGEGTFTVKNFRIETSKTGGEAFASCEGNTIALSKTIKGVLPKDAKFKVQMSDASGEDFGDIDSYQNGDNVYAIIPKGIVEPSSGRKFRIITTNYEGFYEPSNFIAIEAKATAQLTGENGESVLNQIETSANLKVTFTGSGAYNFTLNNPITGFGPYNYDYYFFKLGRTSHNPFIITVKPNSKNDVYYLTSLSNECGFGSYSGEVKIGSVKPTLALSQSNYTATVCAGKELTLRPLIGGDYNTDNVFKIILKGSSTGKTFELHSKSSLDSVVKVTIPKEAQAGYYTISLSSTSPVLTANSHSYTVLTVPNVELSGSTIINSGQHTYIALKGRYGESHSYTLNDGTKGVTNSYDDYGRALIRVSPTQTTEYRVTSISNNCGEGFSSGSAKVIVNPPGDKTISIASIEPGGSFCSGQKITLNITSNATFSATNKFTIQISDQNGENFKDFSTSTITPLVAELPFNLKQGENYRFRVLASDPGISSSASPLLYRIYPAPTAKLLTNNIVGSPNQVAEVKVTLTGREGIYKYLSFGRDSLSAARYTVADSIYTIKIDVKGKEVYKLYRVYDAFCGEGKVLGEKQFVIDIITAQENITAQVVVYPNPTTNRILIKNLGGLSSKISVTNIAGTQSLSPVETPDGATEYELDMQHLPAGTYMLMVEQKNKTFVNKIIKL